MPRLCALLTLLMVSTEPCLAQHRHNGSRYYGPSSSRAYGTQHSGEYHTHRPFGSVGGLRGGFSFGTYGGGVYGGIGFGNPYANRYGVPYYGSYQSYGYGYGAPGFNFYAGPVIVDPYFGGYGPAPYVLPYGYSPPGPIILDHPATQLTLPPGDPRQLDTTEEELENFLTAPPQADPAIRPSNLDSKLKAIRLQAQGDEWFHQKKFFEAYARYKQAASIAQDLPDPRWRMGVTLVAMNSQDQAAREFRRAVAIEPNSTHKTARLVEYFPGNLGEREIDAILDRLATWVQEDIRDPDRLLVMGAMLHLNEDSRRAEPFLTASARFSNSPQLARAFLSAPAAPADGAQPGIAQPGLQPDANQPGAAVPVLPRAPLPDAPVPPRDGLDNNPQPAPLPAAPLPAVGGNGSPQPLPPAEQADGPAIPDPNAPRQFGPALPDGQLGDER